MECLRLLLPFNNCFQAYCIILFLSSCFLNDNDMIISRMEVAEQFIIWSFVSASLTVSLMYCSSKILLNVTSKLASRVLFIDNVLIGTEMLFIISTKKIVIFLACKVHSSWTSP